MKNPFKGKSILISERSLLIVSSKEECDTISDILKQTDDLAKDMFYDLYKINISKLIAYGKGYPPKGLIRKLINCKINGESKIYPCYCNMIVDPNERHKLFMEDYLHEDAISSFSCAIEYLNKPDYLIILDIT